MDESYYANLLDDSANQPTENPVYLSVILSRKTQTHANQANASIRLAVAACIPRKRTEADDPVKYTLQYFSFLDDPRRFTNLDALLTRLSPISVVHVAATESAEVSDFKNRVIFFVLSVKKLIIVLILSIVDRCRKSK